MRAAQVGSKGNSSEAAEPQPEGPQLERADPWPRQWLPCNPEALPSEEEPIPLLSVRAVDAWFTGPAVAVEVGLEPVAGTPVPAPASPGIPGLPLLAVSLLVFPPQLPGRGAERVIGPREEIPRVGLRNGY